MNLSLAAEPRRKCLYEPFFWTRSISSAQASRSAFIPLLFPEPLPYVTLINRVQVLHSRADSDTNRQELPFIRGLDIRLRLDEHGGLAPDLGGTIIPVFNGDLLLVVQKGSELHSQSASRCSSRPTSRPPSSIMDGTVSEKTMSRTPSIRVKTGSSQSLDRKTSVARRNSLPSISQRPGPVVLEPSSERPLRVVVQAGSLDRLVDVLVHGLQNISVSVADDNGEMALRDGKTRDLIVDRVEFAKVWWTVFRSFVTPLVFFEVCFSYYHD
jgi:GTPase-activating protein BEM2